MARGRAHAHLGGDGGLIKLDGERDIHRVGRLLEEALGLLIHALDLAFFHAKDAERLAQLIQVSGAGGQDDDLAARGENALELGGITRGEDDGNGVDGLIPDGQALPYIGHDGADARVALSQVLRSVRGNVEANAAGLRDGVQSMCQVVAGAGAHLEQGGGRGLGQGGGIQSVLDGPGYGLNEGREVAHGQIGLAGVDHIHVIALVLESGAGGKGDIALLGHIKRVAGFRDEAREIIGTRKRGAIVGIGQNVDDMRKHVPRLARNLGQQGTELGGLVLAQLDDDATAAIRGDAHDDFAGLLYCFHFSARGARLHCCHSESPLVNFFSFQLRPFLRGR